MSRVVIKPGNDRILSRGASGLDLRDIAVKADAALAAAQQEAARIIAEARTQATIIQEKARQEGFASGKAEGISKGTEEGRTAATNETRTRLRNDQGQLLAALASALQSFSTQREQFLSAARRDVVALAIAISQRIAHRLVQIDEAAMEMASEACAEALHTISESTEVVIKVHPSDAAAISELTVELADSIKAARGVQLSADESVGRGGVVVTTSDCRIDATVAGRIDRIADELLAGWRKRLEGWSTQS